MACELVYVCVCVFAVQNKCVVLEERAMSLSSYTYLSLYVRCEGFNMNMYSILFYSVCTGQ